MPVHRYMHAEAALLAPCRKAAAEAALDTRNARYRSPGSRDKEESSDEDEDTGTCPKLLSQQNAVDIH